ncbi:long-chain fatty acid--CoA ligase [Pendulispora rubella]|uniref:Long-chain fatty acid--CoA ligase n=1 Tax=Pendulispora rubella TaxID=2741070 RepID=A0ABZ2LDP4_9BACT
MNTSTGVRTLCEAFQLTVQRQPDAVALRTPGDMDRITWREYARRVRCIAAGLFTLGVRRGDTVAIMLTNRPEFHLVDTAAIHLGATPFSVYNTSSVPQLLEILGNANSHVMITERAFLDRAKTACAKVALEHIVCLDDDAPDGAMSLDDLEIAGDEADFDFDTAWHAVQPNDVLTLIYTSGTTGAPKGVELTHANLLAELAGVSAVYSIRHDESVVSYLPSAHIADRMVNHYVSLVFGARVTSVADMRALSAALVEARPSIWGAVPRVWEKMKAGLEARLATTAEESVKQATEWAIGVGFRKMRAEQDAIHGRGPGPDEALLAEYARADEQVLRPVRAMMGLDRARWHLSGAAPIAENVLEFFAAIGVPICEVWGLSESSCVATLNPAEAIRIGTVGPPIPGVELHLAEDGEVLVRGRIVMKGYRGQAKETREAIDGDGWLRTGDIGTIDDAGYLRIIDRKKELIINSAGKNMSPANIEGTLKSASPLIGQAVCIGDRRPYNVALLVLEAEAVASWAKQRGLADLSLAALAACRPLGDAIAAAVGRANERLSRVEQIKRYKLLHAPWEPGGDELTPTMKLKRRPIHAKYAAEIDALYAGDDPADS